MEEKRDVLAQRVAFPTGPVLTYIEVWECAAGDVAWVEKNSLKKWFGGNGERGRKLINAAEVKDDSL